jgi:hypothetical protein
MLCVFKFCIEIGNLKWLPGGCFGIENDAHSIVFAMNP